MTEVQKVRVSDEAWRQVLATATRPPHRLPDAWFEEGVAERMAEWIKRSRELLGDVS